MTTDIVERLFASDEANALTNEAAREIEKLRNPWQDISTAPRDGTELLGYREDCGVLIIRWGEAAEFLTDAEIGKSGDGEWEHEEGWFCADFVAGSRLDGSEAPTHWQPTPTPPKE